MRRTASEVIRSLEMRVARLEKQAWDSFETPGDYYLDNLQEKAIQAILRSFGGVWSGHYGTSSENTKTRVYSLGPVDFDSQSTEIEVVLKINLFEGAPIFMPVRGGSVYTHADTKEARKELDRNLSKLKSLMAPLGYKLQSFSFPKTQKLDLRTNKVERWSWPAGATHFFENRVTEVRFIFNVAEHL